MQENGYRPIENDPSVAPLYRVTVSLLSTPYFIGLYVMKKIVTRTDAHLELNTFRRRSDCALVISGESLEICLSYYQPEFMELATAAPAVVCCRCSPTQKAQVVML